MANLASRPIITACLAWLRPVARWLLKSGVTWKEFAELSRTMFVAVAAEEFGLRGRPTNVSRIALLTGLTRRDVRRYRASPLLATARSTSDDELNHATRVLAGWHLDHEFIDELGRPRPLTASGAGASFAQLVERYAGDIPATTLAKELLRSGSVVRDEDGQFRAVRRYYMPRSMDGRAVERSGHVLADLATTLEHNLVREAAAPSRFEGRAQNRRVAAQHLPAFRAFLEREAQGFLERCDEWLTAHEAKDAQATPKLRLGVGVYAIQERMAGDFS